MFRRTALIAAAVLTVASMSLADGKHKKCIERGALSIEGVAKPGLGAFNGESDDVDVKDEGGKFVFTTDLNKLKMGLRASHTKAAFEIDKYPTAKLTVDKDKLKIPEDNQEVSGDVKAELTLHGQTHPVTVHYKAKRTGSDYHIREASFTFKYIDFKVEKICKLAVCVEPDVNIKLSKHIKLRDE